MFARATVGFRLISVKRFEKKGLFILRYTRQLEISKGRECHKFVGYITFATDTEKKLIYEHGQEKGHKGNF